METVLNVVRNSISADKVPAELPAHAKLPPQALQEERLFLEDDIDWEYHGEQIFDDTGEGAGVEGDLEEGED